jgi:DNA-binding NarL/FixJ family response regulator
MIMRARPNQTIEQLAGQLDEKQAEWLYSLSERRRIEQRAQGELNERQYELRGTVLEALKAGIPAKLIANRLNVSDKRIYQMRDLARTEAESVEMERQLRLAEAASPREESA